MAEKPHDDLVLWDEPLLRSASVAPSSALTSCFKGLTASMSLNALHNLLPHQYLGKHIPSVLTLGHPRRKTRGHSHKKQELFLYNMPVSFLYMFSSKPEINCEKKRSWQALWNLTWFPMSSHAVSSSCVNTLIPIVCEQFSYWDLMFIKIKYCESNMSMLQKGKGPYRHWCYRPFRIFQFEFYVA